jgi:queuine tRNA-ribosyltransferase subunit QTRTD1
MNCPSSIPLLHAFTALPASLITLLAPRRTPAVSAPNGNTNTSISLFTSVGFQTLTNASYISYVRALRPDIAIALADVPYGIFPGTKRTAKMGDRTQAWVSHLLDAKDQDQAVFAPVLPIDFHSQSEYLQYVADDLVYGIAGLAFYDSSLLPDIPATTALSRLPRLSLDEPSSPHQILRQIALGMDIFTIPFIGFATDAGIALTFRFPHPLYDDEESSTENGISIRPLGVDMWTPTHATSLLPLGTSCTCSTCVSHHRAYVQHLLSAKEMLGWVLLQIHNHHVLSEFFTNIRSSIEKGTFEEDCGNFERSYESELPEKSGQGPRIRGYHFRSEAACEGKKNRPAWGNLGGHEDGGLVPEGGAEVLEERGFAEKADD